MPGIRIAHNSARSSIVLVPILAKPFPGPFHVEKDKCPSCHQIHMVKTVHLLFDADGTCIVSKGVFKDLQTAGLPGLTVMAEVLKPPALTFGPGMTREQIDNHNRRIVWLGQPVHT